MPVRIVFIEPQPYKISLLLESFPTNLIDFFFLTYRNSIWKSANIFQRSRLQSWWHFGCKLYVKSCNTCTWINMVVEWQKGTTHRKFHWCYFRSTYLSCWYIIIAFKLIQAEKLLERIIVTLKNILWEQFSSCFKQQYKKKERLPSNCVLVSAENCLRLLCVCWVDITWAFTASVLRFKI